MVLLKFNAREYRPLMVVDQLAEMPVANDDDVLSDLSPASRRLLDEFSAIPDTYRKSLLRPPGIAGRLVDAAMSSTHRPFLKFAIPATLATLSGIVGRRYKIGSKQGDGTAINVILAAVSNAGKSDIIEAWRNFCWKASAEVQPNGQPPQRVHSHSTASVQALMTDLAESPTGVWSIEEAKALLDALLHPKTVTEQGLADGFRSLWDASKHTKTFSGPRSIRGRQDGEKPIRNISLSTFLALPVNELTISDANALDGVLSRILVIRHKGSTVPLHHDVQRELPADLNQLLVRLIADAGKLDELYARDALAEAFEQLVAIDFSPVDQLHKDLTNQVDRHVRKGQDEDTVYVALGRLHVFVKRIAGTLAVLENPNLPIVSLEQYYWSFGYVLRNFVRILSDHDTGEVGDRASDEEETVRRTVRDMLKADSRWRKVGGVPKKELRDKLKHRAPFSGIKNGKSQVITKTLDDMLSNGELRVVDDPSVGAAAHRHATYLAVGE